MALPRVPPRSALGISLNPIEEALFHLLAGLLDLLKLDFASAEVRAASRAHSAHGPARANRPRRVGASPPTLPSTPLRLHP